MAAVDRKNSLKNRIYARRRKKSFSLLVLFFVALAVNYFLVKEIYDWAYGNMEYVIIISVFLALYARLLIISKGVCQISSSRLIFLLVGVVSSVSVISYIRDLSSGQYRFLVDGKISQEASIFIMALIFFLVFVKYFLYEKKRSNKKSEEEINE